MRTASVLSTHPVAAIALGEAAGQVLESLGGARPTLVLATVTPPHLGTLEDVGTALEALLAPEVVVGAVSSAIVGGGRHVEAEPALALFALSGVTAAPLSIVAQPDRTLVRHGALLGATAAVVLADPFSCSGPGLLAAVGDVPAAGGMVEGARGPGGSRLLLDDEVRTAGAVGALLGPPAQALASQGWTPVGEPWVVTSADGDVVLELGGRPARERRAQALGDDHEPAAVGLLLDERVEEPGRGELLAVPILGSAPTGGLRLARPLPVGGLVRFLRTGPLELEADLVAALRCAATLSIGVLLFPTPGRAGDAEVTSELLGCPIGGVGVSAPLAPVGGVASLHGSGATGLIVFP